MFRARRAGHVSAEARSGLPEVNARGPIVELVTDTGSREIAVLIYTSATPERSSLAAAPRDHAPRVYGIAVRILGAPTQAEAIPLDSELAVWRTATVPDSDQSSPMAWIRAMAHRRAADRMRPTPAVNSPSAPVAALGRPVPRPTRRQDRAASTEVHRVREALARLNPEQCAALELVYFDGYAEVQPTDLGVIMATLVNRTLPPEPPERSMRTRVRS